MRIEETEKRTPTFKHHHVPIKSALYLHHNVIRECAANQFEFLEIETFGEIVPTTLRELKNHFLATCIFRRANMAPSDSNSDSPGYQTELASKRARNMS